MSFMSFDYAMRAADAALQFQQSQGQNIKDTNSRVREVGTGNAKRKDDLVRQKIEAEYASKSADIKKDKALRLAQLAQERKQGAVFAQFAVGIAAFGGGMLDGIVDICKGNKDKVPDSEQMTIDKGAVEAGYASAFRIANGNGNTEDGAIASYDPKKGNFNLVSMDTTSGKVKGFVQMSATDMAKHILDKTKGMNDDNAKALNSMIDQGPPPMFKKECFDAKGEHGEHSMSPKLREALFGKIGADGKTDPNNAGFFASGSRTTQESGGQTGTELGENLAAELLRDPAQISTAYGPTANSIVDMLKVDNIRAGLDISEDTAGKATRAFEDAGHKIGGFDQAMSVGGDILSKAIFKPLGTALPQFMELAKVAKQYEEEYAQKMAEYDAAKKQAALAREKLQKLESLLAAGSHA